MGNMFSSYKPADYEQFIFNHEPSDGCLYNKMFETAEGVALQLKNDKYFFVNSVIINKKKSCYYDAILDRFRQYFIDTKLLDLESVKKTKHILLIIDKMTIQNDKISKLYKKYKKAGLATELIKKQDGYSTRSEYHLCAKAKHSEFPLKLSYYYLPENMRVLPTAYRGNAFYDWESNVDFYCFLFVGNNSDDCNTILGEIYLMNQKEKTPKLSFETIYNNMLAKASDCDENTSDENSNSENKEEEEEGKNIE